jgi:enterochelin esterase-like enzyme
MLVLAGTILAGLLAAAGIAATPPAQDLDFQSQAIGDDLHYVVYLPAGYDDSTTTAYPVIYLLHGLPATSTGYLGMSFIQSALAAAPPAIVVAPQASRDGETDPEYLDHGPGDRWDTALTQELVRAVDAGFRTIRSRGARALVGVSAGGYGAMHLGLQHLDEFSVVESWSGYFHPTDPTGTKKLDLGSAAANAHANVHRQLQASVGRLKSLPTFIAFYVGRSDSRFSAENQQLNQELSRDGVPHIFRIYAGGHDQSLWREYATAWVRLALAHLDPAQG